jgi:hypothetical protein
MFMLLTNLVFFNFKVPILQTIVKNTNRQIFEIIFINMKNGMKTIFAKNTNIYIHFLKVVACVEKLDYFKFQVDF